MTKIELANATQAIIGSRKAVLLAIEDLKRSRTLLATSLQTVDRTLEEIQAVNGELEFAPVDSAEEAEPEASSAL